MVSTQGRAIITMRNNSFLQAENKISTPGEGNLNFVLGSIEITRV